MPEATRSANGRRSAVSAFVEHVFAEQKKRISPFNRTIGLSRATTKIGLANLAHDMKRLIWLERSEIVRSSSTEKQIAIQTSTSLQNLLLPVASRPKNHVDRASGCLR
jgi:hypothetical protein